MRGYTVMLSTVLSSLILSRLTSETKIGRNAAVCSTTCDIISNPCRCYQDGYVDCKAKNLTTIPSPMPQCTRRISISRNGITELSLRGFQGMMFLHTMEITNESITEIPSGVFSGLTALTTLKLTNNIIRRVAECAFQGLSSLQTLYLSKNNITTLEAKSFRGLSALQSLHLDNNQISSIDLTLFRGLSNLEYIHLQSNDLTQIPGRALEGLTNLTSINIYNNRFSKLNIDWFDDVNNLVLLVGNNPWNCTCDLKEDYSFILTSFSTNVHCPIPVQGLNEAFFNHMCITCSYPAHLAGQTLRDISMSSFTDCNSAENVERIPTDQGSITPRMVEPTPPEDTNYCKAKIERLKTAYLLQSTKPTESPTSITTTTSNTELALTTVEELTSTEHNKSSANSSMPIWVIILIIILVLLLTAISGVVAILIVRRSGRKIVKEDTADKTEMQPKTFSNKSYDAVN